MILTNINLTSAQNQYPDAINRAISYLKTHDFLAMDVGDYPIEGNQLVAKVFDAVSQKLENTKPEIHKKYIDVQFWPQGEELMGYAPNLGNMPIIISDDEKDLYFLDDFPDNNMEIFLPAKKGDIMVLFPEDIHRPAVQKSKKITYRKVVIKVSVDLL